MPVGRDIILVFPNFVILSGIPICAHMYSIPIAGLRAALATGHIRICRVSPAIVLHHDAFSYL